MKENKPGIILVTGGARSGKSTFAERLAGEIGEKVVYIATAQGLDEEMCQRIKNHQSKRPSHWVTIEEPYQVGKVIGEKSYDADVIIVDCLTLLVSNLMKNYQDHKRQEDNQKITDDIIHTIEKMIQEGLKCKATVILVSNEVGSGIVPGNPIGRFFRDMLGQTNQMIARKADHVYLMVSGIPVLIKGRRDEKHF